MDNPIRLHWLDPRNPQQAFPPQSSAMRDPNGLLAIGGDLSVTRMIRAYSQGIFPWYNPDEPILWWCPDPRAVLLPSALHVSRSLGKSIRRGDYAMTMNQAPGAVLAACAGPRRGSRGTWLGPDMRRAYLELHEAGFCQTVEVWRHGRLVGGLYGLAIGRAFFGESMFSKEPDGSKVALAWLCRQLEAWRYELIDCQISSAHLRTLGAVDISRERFLTLLRQAGANPGRTGKWSFEIAVPAPRQHRPERP